MNAEISLAKKNARLGKQLLIVVIGMFAFATLILPPLYDVLCDITGLNGKIELKAAAKPDVPTLDSNLDLTESVASKAISAHTVNVEFTTKVHSGMPWTFKAQQNSTDASPGVSQVVLFDVHNPTNQTMTAQAIPSISPAHAAQYVRKMECFCFQEQVLAARESKSMPLRFYLDESTPSDIKELTLSYTLYNKDQKL